MPCLTVQKRRRNRFCTQIVLKRQKHIPQTQYFQGLRDVFNSLQLNRSGRFARQVVEYAVDAFHFVDDAAHRGLQDSERDVGALGGHEIAGDHGAQGYRVIVGAEVTHDSYGTHVGKSCKVLGRHPGRIDTGRILCGYAGVFVYLSGGVLPAPCFCCLCDLIVIFFSE